MSVLMTSFQFRGDNCRMNLANFRKHVFQKLLVVSGSNLVDVLLKAGASNIMLTLMTSFPFPSFDGMGFSMWLDHLVLFLRCKVQTVAITSLERHTKFHNMAITSL